jgi:hypothetical protein
MRCGIGDGRGNLSCGAADAALNRIRYLKQVVQCRGVHCEQGETRSAAGMS